MIPNAVYESLWSQTISTCQDTIQWHPLRRNISEPCFTSTSSRRSLLARLHLLSQLWEWVTSCDNVAGIWDQARRDRRVVCPYCHNSSRLQLNRDNTRHNGNLCGASPNGPWAKTGHRSMTVDFSFYLLNARPDVYETEVLITSNATQKRRCTVLAFRYMRIQHATGIVLAGCVWRIWAWSEWLSTQPYLRLRRKGQPQTGA